MPTKLKKLKITSTDLVDQGANPDAFIRLFKRNLPVSNPPVPNPATSNNPQNNTQELTDTMKIDKSKMTPEELNIFEDFEKRYAQNDEPAPELTPDDSPSFPTLPPENNQLHPEVKKALEEFENIKKSQLAQIEELKKSLEIERLTSVAKKYEILGKKSDELASKLYELKKSSDTVYNDYVALLDENLAIVEKSGTFTELGSDNSGPANATEKLEAAASEIAKSQNVNTPDSIVKAWESNPELAAAYENEYQKRR